MVVDSSGNVGIGTSSPGDKLSVIGAGQFNVNANGTSTPLKLSNDNTTGTVVAKLAFQNQGSIKASINGAVYNNDFLTFNTGSDTERMRINSNGDLLINTTSVVSAGKLNINFPSGTNGIDIKFTNASNNGSFIGFFNSTSGLAGVISQTGATTVSYTTSSDYRLKENIVPMTGALDKVALLKPVTYTWKSDGLDGQGFIAHELQAVVPDAVVGEKDAVDSEGNIQPQSVDTSFLVATLTAAIQEMKAIIDAQSATINDLKARIETLEGK
jgi:hypothetical protein